MKKDKKNHYIGSWKESTFANIDLLFSVENLKFLLSQGKDLDSNYTHQQIADWCIRFFLEFNELRRTDEDLTSKMKKIAFDVDAQWGLYLANTFPLDELKKMDFSKVHLPIEWFEQWLKDLKCL